MPVNFTLASSYGINNVIVPKNGPKAVAARLDFSATPQIEVDGLYITSNGQIEYLQGMFVDNADNPDPISFTMDGTGQRVICPPNHQGYFAIMQPNPPKILVATVQAANRVINVHFYNVPIQTQVWSAV